MSGSSVVFPTPDRAEQRPLAFNPPTLTEPAWPYFAVSGTRIDTVLHHLGVDTLVVTNGCVENAVRAASDLSYRTILVEDACAAQTRAPHETAVHVLKDVYCNVRATAEILAELQAL